MTDELRKTVGKGLRDVREQRRYSQASVAEALGVTQATVSRWESGEAAPTAVDVTQLAVLYDAAPAELLPAADDIAKASTNDLRRRAKELAAQVNKTHFKGER